MAFWCRGVIKHLQHQIRRLHSQRNLVSYPHHRLNAISESSSGVARTNPDWRRISRRPGEFCDSLRFFAAPAKYQKKKDEDEEEGKSGPRLNEEITGHMIRLVISDEEHTIMSLREAFQRAQTQGLDLVEVNRKADPPVCKIMDYHKEKYLKETKDKELTKSKVKMKSDFKEIKINTKTEQKDLEIKAKNVMRLMESGYRVKCTAEGRDNEDLAGKLASLCALLEDVAIVESGPFLERKQAYTVLRHKKFGQPKKSVKKTVISEDSSTEKQAIKVVDSGNSEQLINPDAERSRETHKKKKSTHSESGTFDSGRNSYSSPRPAQPVAINEDMQYRNNYTSRFPETKPTFGPQSDTADGSGLPRGRFPRPEISFTNNSPPGMADGFRRGSPSFSPPNHASIHKPIFEDPTSNRMGTEVRGNMERGSPGPPDPSFRPRYPQPSAMPHKNVNESNMGRGPRPNHSMFRNSNVSTNEPRRQHFFPDPRNASTSYGGFRDGRANFQDGGVESAHNPQSGRRPPTTAFEEYSEPEKRFGIFSKR